MFIPYLKFLQPRAGYNLWVSSNGNRTGDTHGPRSPSRGSRQQAAARLSLLSNAFLVLIKIAAGLASGSISLLAEGIQSTVDVVASALILVTVRAASAPPDSRHPYGHGK